MTTEVETFKRLRGNFYVNKKGKVVLLKPQTWGKPGGWVETKRNPEDIEKAQDQEIAKLEQQYANN